MGDGKDIIWYLFPVFTELLYLSSLLHKRWWGGCYNTAVSLADNNVPPINNNDKDNCSNQQP